MNHITNPDLDNIQNDDIEDIALPSIDSFSFDGILKAIDPAGNLHFSSPLVIVSNRLS